MILSLIGVVLSIGLLIALVYKRISLLMASMICVTVLAVFNGFPITAMLQDAYIAKLVGFIGKNFLIFFSSALFGHVMEETLLAASFSRLIGKVFGTKNAVFGAMLATALLIYGGVSVFVIVFTVYPIFLDTFQRANLPRKLIPACIMSSSCTFALAMLPGSAQLNNIIPMDYLGTDLMAAPAVGLISAVFSMVYLVVYFKYEIWKCQNNGEVFVSDASIEQRLELFSRDPGFPSWLSAVPLAAIVLLINVFHVPAFCAMLTGTALALLIGHKNVKSIIQTIDGGLKIVPGPMLTIAASVGFGGAILACPCVQEILYWFISLPLNPIASLGIVGSLIAAMVGNGGGATDVSMQLLTEPYLAAGVAPELLHRLVGMSALGLSCLPHNGTIATSIDTCGCTTKESYKYIFSSTVLCGITSLIVGVIVGGLLYPIGG